MLCWVKNLDEEAQKIMSHVVLVPLPISVQPHCMLFHKPSCKDQTRFKKHLRTTNLLFQWLEKAISTNQPEKIVLSLKTMKRASSPCTNFSCGYPIMMPLCVSMSSTGIAAFPGKDSFPALNKVSLHSWPTETFHGDEITHRMSPWHFLLHLI